MRLFFRWAWVLRFRGVSFFRGIVLEPVLAHQSLLWLSCSYPGWLLASLAFVSGCSFGSVGIQASVCFALPTSFGFSGSNFFRLNLFPLKACPSPPFSCPTSLSCCPCFFFQFPLISHVVGSLLSPLDLCNTSKSKPKNHSHARICHHAKSPDCLRQAIPTLSKEKEALHTTADLLHVH